MGRQTNKQQQKRSGEVFLHFHRILAAAFACTPYSPLLLPMSEAGGSLLLFWLHLFHWNLHLDNLFINLPPKLSYSHFYIVSGSLFPPLSLCSVSLSLFLMLFYSTFTHFYLPLYLYSQILKG